jgi:hypothetical protein
MRGFAQRNLLKTGTESVSLEFRHMAIENDVKTSINRETDSVPVFLFSVILFGCAKLSMSTWGEGTRAGAATAPELKAGRN